MFVHDLAEAARERLVTIADGSTLMDAARLLTSGTDIVAVCDGTGALRGVLTKTDVVKQISACQGATCMCPVSTVMTRDVALCREGDHLQDVSKVMNERRLKNMPVVDAADRPVGVLTARAVLRTLLSEAEYDEALLIDYVKGIGYR